MSKRTVGVKNNQVEVWDEYFHEIIAWFRNNKSTIIEMDTILKTHGTEKEYLIYSVLDLEEYIFFDKHHDMCESSVYNKVGGRIDKLRSTYHSLKDKITHAEKFITNELIWRNYNAV